MKKIISVIVLVLVLLFGCMVTRAGDGTPERGFWYKAGKFFLSEAAVGRW